MFEGCRNQLSWVRDAPTPAPYTSAVAVTVSVSVCSSQSNPHLQFDAVVAKGRCHQPTS